MIRHPVAICQRNKKMIFAQRGSRRHERHGHLHRPDRRGDPPDRAREAPSPGSSSDDAEFALDASIVELAERRRGLAAAPSPASAAASASRAIPISRCSSRAAPMSACATSGPKPPRASTPASVAEDIVAKAQNALFQMHQASTSPPSRRRRELLRGAGMIHAFGSGGNSSMIVHELANRLFRLGCRISASSDHGMNLMLVGGLRPRRRRLRLLLHRPQRRARALLPRASGARHPDDRAHPERARRSPRPPRSSSRSICPRGSTSSARPRPASPVSR